MIEKIKIGISSCLLGNKVRWDGDHKQDRFLTDTLGKYLEFVPVCPEAECGLGIPREPLRLEGSPESLRLIAHDTRLDHTERMVLWSDRKLTDLALENLCGFVFKSKSPTCGMERIPVYKSTGGPGAKEGVGIFAKAFMTKFPEIPVEDDGRLHDPKLRENFVEMIFTLQRWRQTRSEMPKMRHLIDFHTRNKLLILSHSPEIYRRMGKLAAGDPSQPAQELFNQYQALLMDALKLATTVKKNINVLMHLMGYFKKDLSADEKQEILEIIESYRNGAVPLIVPITLINHYVRKYREPYLSSQTYLNPHPVSLKLRNHA